MRKNKLFFRNRVCVMPRLRNLPPYESNDIAEWFAHVYRCDTPAGRKLFDKARVLSRRAEPFLVFDRTTREWHGVDVP
jgi:hypothetical protein